MSDETLARPPRNPQLPRVSDTVTTARRWNSFVCPGCRCVFRVPQDHDGTGVVCPACRVMLRLPGPDDDVPPLVSAPAAMPVPHDAAEYEDPESDEAVTAARSDRNFIAILAVAAVFLIGLFAWWMMPGKKAPAAVVDTAPPVLPSPPPEAVAGGDTGQPKPLLLEIETVVGSFLNAPTRDDALAYVLDPAGTREKWDAWFAGERYVAPGFQGIVGESSTTGVGEGAVSVIYVRVSDYTLREITLVRHDGKMKVDWDSWVGWSEMSWEEFRKKKPAEPTLFRVNLSGVQYFNFAFSDDREWSSYRLDSPDGEDSIYGYVRRTGLLDQRLRPIEAKAKSRWLLKLKFPPDATRDDQVLIDSIVAEGWVMERKAGE